MFLLVMCLGFDFKLYQRSKVRCHGCSDFRFLQLTQMLQKLTLWAKNSRYYVRVFFSLWLKQKSGTGIKPSKTRKIKPVPVSLRQRNLAGSSQTLTYNKIKKETTCCTFKLPVRRWIHSGVFQICENRIVTERIKTAGVFSFDLWRTYVLVVFGGGFPLLRKFVVFD